MQACRDDVINMPELNRYHCVAGDVLTPSAFGREPLLELFSNEHNKHISQHYVWYTLYDMYGLICTLHEIVRKRNGTFAITAMNVLRVRRLGGAGAVPARAKLEIRPVFGGAYAFGYLVSPETRALIRALRRDERASALYGNALAATGLRVNKPTLIFRMQ
ncbi:jg15153 [Pararge aegeria aegeria]|uniref:Jg15153 protein n=1 Tax=Pararge aegeria aegeria TaxID=348720 RepID=A0A8S4S3K1_9NEOP|nr:jg15153 [Pararge aegeria aegeria]